MLTSAKLNTGDLEASVWQYQQLDARYARINMARCHIERRHQRAWEAGG